MLPDINPFISVQIPYLTAFLAGVFGGVHCLGMCGGVSSVLVFGLAPEKRDSSAGLAPYLVAYNIGRISTYTLLGGVVGWLGMQGGEVIADYQGWRMLRVLAGLLMVAMGLYLGGWWFGLLKIERMGGTIWRWIEPLRKGLLPVQSVPQAYLFGLVWGLLPCGLIYTLLIWSLASGGAAEGAGFLLAFGLGTLPLMLAVGFGAKGVAEKLQSGRWRSLAGALVIAFGLWTLIGALAHSTNVGLGCLPPS